MTFISLLRRLRAMAARRARSLFHVVSYILKSGHRPPLAVNKIVQSGLFDLDFYNFQAKEGFASILEAAEHYIKEGAASGRNPNAFFDSQWYLATYPDVLREGRNPLVDFLARAPRFDRNPSAAFDCAWYLSRNPDVAQLGGNPLQHFLTFGHSESRAGSPFAGDAHVPVRFVNLLYGLERPDREVRFQGSFEVEAVPDSLRVGGPVESAASQWPHLPPGGIAQRFPPKPYIATFRDVGIVGGTRLILPDSSKVLSDEIAAFRSTPGWAVRPFDLNIGEGGKLVLQLRRSYPSHVQRGAHLMHEYAGNYFHMVAELLPRLLAAEELGLDPSLPLLVQSELHPNLRQLIEILNERDRQIIPLDNRKIYTAHELHFISDVASIQDVYERPRLPEETVLHQRLTRRVAERVIAALAPEPPPNPWRRIYVRRGNYYRAPLNEQLVEEFLLNEGFELVLVDGLSLAAQVILFRQAAVVVAPTGAAVTNVLWCRPGTRVCVISAQHDAMPLEVWQQLCEIAGCMFSALRCKRAYDRDDVHSLHDNFSVDLGDLREAVGRLTSQPHEP